MVPTLATITSQFLDWIAHNGVYAVFGLMALDALLPVGGELIMLYAGVVASGAVAGHHAMLFGTALAPGLESYVVLSLAGALGYLVGALVGWAIGAYGGRELIERHGRVLHISPETFDRAERWFDRYGSRAVLFGRVTPVVRSFISVPAGVLGSPLGRYTVLTLIGSLVWCFGFAAAGWALCGSWEQFHHDFRYADYAAVALVVIAGAALLVRQRRRRRVA